MVDRRGCERWKVRRLPSLRRAPRDEHPAQWTWWANFDAGFEGRAISSGLTYRFFAGVARPFGGCLGGNGERCAGAGVLPMLGVALGSLL